MLDPQVLPFYRRGTFAEFMASLYFQLTIVMSMTASSAIAICRFINIKYPFYKIKNLAVIAISIITATTYMILITLFFSQMGKAKSLVVWNRHTILTFYMNLDTSASRRQSHTYSLLILIRAIRTVIVGTGVVISLMAVLQLSRITTTSELSRENIKKSSKVIAAMNIFNMIVVIINIVSGYMQDEFPLQTFLTSVGLYFIGAGINPAIRILACKDILKYCKSLLTLGNNSSAKATSSSTAKFASNDV